MYPLHFSFNTAGSGSSHDMCLWPESRCGRVAGMWGRESNVAVTVCGRATQWIRAYFTGVFQLIVQSAEWLDNPAVSC